MHTNNKYTGRSIWLAAAFLLIALSGCGGDGTPVSFGSVSTPPTVVGTGPADGATGVGNTTKLTATFSDVMNGATIIANFTVSDGGGLVAGTVSYDAASKTATFTQTPGPLVAGLVTATLTTGVTNSAGLAMTNNYVWSFTALAAADVTSPTVVSTHPVGGSTGHALDRSVSAAFSEDLDPATVNAATFTLSGGVTGTVSYVNKVATFNPTSNLTALTTYTATLTTGITDLAATPNPMLALYSWTFTTGTTVGLAAVNLRTAGTFVILSKSGITNVHTSAITGNIGASPITAAAMDNVFCSEITGTIYGVDAAYTGSGAVGCFLGGAPYTTLVNNAVLDMGTAYTDAAGRTIPDFTDLNAGAIGGLTLVPGLYKYTTGISINTDVTLAGGPNDVWIFQIAGDITQASGTKVLLGGGALAKNIFWQVAGGTGVAIGTTAHFEGVLLAIKAITVNTGASVNGRLLAQTAVTLNQNAVTQPAP